MKADVLPGHSLGHYTCAILYSHHWDGISMDPSNPLRLVHFQNPDDFLEATKNFDDSYMNFAVGALLDSQDTSQPHAHWGGGPRTLLGIHRGDDVFVGSQSSRSPQDFFWIISTPHNGKQLIDNAGIPSVVQPFVTYLPSIIDPKSFDKLLGPDKYVDAFLECWVSHMTLIGRPMKLLKPYFRSKDTF